MSATIAATIAATAPPGQGPAPVPVADPAKVEGSIRWADAELLPCRLSAEIDIARFTVRDLFCLEVDSVLDTGWAQSTDVPLKANSHLLGWVEFEVIGERLAVRLTELY
jgi:flagellar motor switch/type III secretory pathway protein FliN